MDLTEALRCVAGGAGITQPEWPEGYYAALEDRILCLYKPDTNQFHPWTITADDLAVKDYRTLTNG
jgi:hypothetical protein